MLLRHICKLVRDEGVLDIDYDTVDFKIYINNQKATAADLCEDELREVQGFLEFRHLKLNSEHGLKIDHYGSPAHLL